MTKKHRRTLRTPRDGVLKVQYGKPDRWSNPDICYNAGKGCWSEGHLLYYYLGCPRIIQDRFTEEGYRREESLWKELEARGYDLTTIKFSIEKKKGS